MNAIAPTIWTGEVLTQFQALIADSNSAGQIAQKLSAQFGFRISRCAVAGKAHRLCLTLRGGKGGNVSSSPRNPRSPKLRTEQSTRRQLRRATKMGIEFDYQASFMSAFGVNPTKFIETDGCRYPHHEKTEDGDMMCCNSPIALPGEVTPRVKMAAPMYCVGHALIATNPRAP